MDLLGGRTQIAANSTRKPAERLSNSNTSRMMVTAYSCVFRFKTKVFMGIAHLGTLLNQDCGD